MIDITVKKDNERVAVVRFFGWGIFDRFGKARLIDAEELANYQRAPSVPERNGFENMSGKLEPAECSDGVARGLLHRHLRDTMIGGRCR